MIPLLMPYAASGATAVIDFSAQSGVIRVGAGGEVTLRGVVARGLAPSDSGKAYALGNLLSPSVQLAPGSQVGLAPSVAKCCVRLLCSLS